MRRRPRRPAGKPRGNRAIRHDRRYPGFRRAHPYLRRSGSRRAERTDSRLAAATSGRLSRMQTGSSTCRADAFCAVYVYAQELAYLVLPLRRTRTFGRKSLCTSGILPRLPARVKLPRPRIQAGGPPEIPHRCGHAVRPLDLSSFPTGKFVLWRSMN